MTTSNSHRPRARRACLVFTTSLLLALPAGERHAAAQTTPSGQPSQMTPAPGTPGPPSAADLESARELFKEGRELRQAGDVKHALERFKAAHAYGQTPVTALELGRTHIQLGELIEGREVLLSVARMKVQPDETDKSAAARTEAADLAEDAKKRIPTLTVKLTGVASDSAAQLQVDGSPVPVVGLTGIRKVNPGKHTIVARAGTHEETRNVDLQETTTQELTIDLGGGGGTAAAPTEPVTPEQTGPREISPVTWIGLGVGVVGIGVGTVTGILALGKASKVDKACTSTHCPPSEKSEVDSGRTVATISTIGFAVGGAGLVAAAVGYLFLSKPKTTATGVTPFITASSIGLDGTF